MISKDTSAFFKVFEEDKASEVLKRIIRLIREKKIQIVLLDWSKFFN